MLLAWPFSDFQACFLQGFLLGRFHATLYKAVGNQNKSVIRLIARAAAILHKSFFNAPSRMKDCPLHSTHGKSQVSIFSNLNALNFVSSALYFSPPFDEHQTVQNPPLRYKTTKNHQWQTTAFQQDVTIDDTRPKIWTLPNSTWIKTFYETNHGGGVYLAQYTGDM